MKKRLFSAFALSAALLTLCSCGNKKSSGSVSSEVQATEAVTEAVTQPETIPPTTAVTTEKGQGTDKPYEEGDTINPGLWQSCHTPTMDFDYEECAYYEIRKDGTGTIIYQENGSKLDFSYGLSGKNLFIMFEDAENAENATVNFINADLNEINYENGYTESWSYLSDTPAAELEFYTNVELTEMSRQFFNKTADTDKVCEYTEISYDSGMVVVSLFDNIESHQKMETYTIDQFTGKGRDSSGAEIDLTSIDLSTSGWG